MKLTEKQRYALAILSFGVPVNLRRLVAKATVVSLLDRQLISETKGERREHSITQKGLRALADSQ